MKHCILFQREKIRFVSLLDKVDTRQYGANSAHSTKKD